jgi:putative methionine-R-sulfoxide reductase with GAF domain
VSNPPISQPRPRKQLDANVDPRHAPHELDESTALTCLRDLVASGDHRLDTVLETLADSACQLTGATGVAIAMWKDGAMICRARSGDTAPPLGARLSADTGISGACLRTGRVQNCADTENDPIVDVEVCRRLGLRSIVVLPIQGWRGINGILEIFSSQPVAFTEHNITLLQQLAALAERARAAKPHGASASAPRPPSAIERRKPSGLLPASDRVGDVAGAFFGTRSRPLLLSIGLVVMSLLAFAFWLGWQGADEVESSAHGTVALSSGTGSVNNVPVNNVPLSAVGVPDIVKPSVVVAAPSLAEPTLAKPSLTEPSLKDANKDSLSVGNSNSRTSKQPMDDDPVWSPNPGGERLFSSNGKPSAGMPLKFAAKVDRIGKKKIASNSPVDHSHSPHAEAPLLLPSD